MPGQENTFSTSTLPPTRIDACNPAKVTSGISALRKMCRRATARSVNPLARAVLTKSWPSTSIMAVRVSRA